MTGMDSGVVVGISGAAVNTWVAGASAWCGGEADGEVASTCVGVDDSWCVCVLGVARSGRVVVSVARVGPLLVSALGFVLVSVVAGWGAVLVGGSLLLVVTVWLLLGLVWVDVVAAGLSGSAVSVGGSLRTMVIVAITSSKCGLMLVCARVCGSVRRACQRMWWLAGGAGVVGTSPT